MSKSAQALQFKVESLCQTTRARCGILTLKQSSGLEINIDTPIFMPVGTNGTMKGLLPVQLENTGCRLMLSNTYHLAARPGANIIQQAGGLHKFINWKHALLTDSGGFQMVSLSKLTTITEEGATFTSPYNSKQTISLTPEKAIQIQHQIGANIIMQLDDVISSTVVDKEKFKQAKDRTVRWYDRCREVHRGRENKQNLFPIIQGGLDSDLRLKCVSEMIARNPPGIAIGGLSGGENKELFIKMVHCSTLNLPPSKPRYLMGVGFSVDLLLCSALGCDMFDCVFPTRTARFGFALIGLGTKINLKSSKYMHDFSPIEIDCDCATCASKYKRAYIYHLLKNKNCLGCHLLTQHNIRFQLKFMEKIRNAIKSNSFNELIKQTLDSHYQSSNQYPTWVTTALNILSIKL